MHRQSPKLPSSPADLLALAPSFPSNSASLSDIVNALSCSPLFLSSIPSLVKSAPQSWFLVCEALTWTLHNLPTGNDKNNDDFADFLQIVQFAILYPLNSPLHLHPPVQDLLEILKTHLRSSPHDVPSTLKSFEKTWTLLSPLPDSHINQSRLLAFIDWVFSFDGFRIFMQRELDEREKTKWICCRVAQMIQYRSLDFSIRNLSTQFSTTNSVPIITDPRVRRWVGLGMAYLLLTSTVPDVRVTLDILEEVLVWKDVEVARGLVWPLVCLSATVKGTDGEALGRVLNRVEETLSENWGDLETGHIGHGKDNILTSPLASTLHHHLHYNLASLPSPQDLPFLHPFLLAPKLLHPSIIPNLHTISPAAAIDFLPFVKYLINKSSPEKIMHIYLTLIPRLVHSNSPVLTSKLITLIQSLLRPSLSSLMLLALQSMIKIWTNQPRVWNILVIMLKAWTRNRRVLTNSNPLEELVEVKVIACLIFCFNHQPSQTCEEILAITMTLLEIRDWRPECVVPCLDLAYKAVDLEVTSPRALWELGMQRIFRNAAKAGHGDVFVKVIEFLGVIGKWDDASETNTAFKTEIVTETLLPLMTHAEAQIRDAAMTALSMYPPTETLELIGQIPIESMTQPLIRSIMQYEVINIPRPIFKALSQASNRTDSLHRIALDISLTLLEKTPRDVRGGTALGNLFATPTLQSFPTMLSDLEAEVVESGPLGAGFCWDGWTRYWTQVSPKSNSGEFVSETLDKIIGLTTTTTSPPTLLLINSLYAAAALGIVHSASLNRILDDVIGPFSNHSEPQPRYLDYHHSDTIQSAVSLVYAYVLNGIKDLTRVQNIASWFLLDASTGMARTAAVALFGLVKSFKRLLDLEDFETAKKVQTALEGNIGSANRVWLAFGLVSEVHALSTTEFFSRQLLGSLSRVKNGISEISDLVMLGPTCRFGVLPEDDITFVQRAIREQVKSCVRTPSFSSSTLYMFWSYAHSLITPSLDTTQLESSSEYMSHITEQLDLIQNKGAHSFVRLGALLSIAVLSGVSFNPTTNQGQNCHYRPSKLVLQSLREQLVCKDLGFERALRALLGALAGNVLFEPWKRIEKEPEDFSRLIESSRLRQCFDILVRDKHSEEFSLKLLTALTEIDTPLPPVNWLPALLRQFKHSATVKAQCIRFSIVHLDKSHSKSLMRFLLSVYTLKDLDNEFEILEILVGDGFGTLLSLFGLDNVYHASRIVGTMDMDIISRTNIFDVFSMCVEWVFRHSNLEAVLELRSLFCATLMAHSTSITRTGDLVAGSQEIASVSNLIRRDLAWLAYALLNDVSPFISDIDQYIVACLTLTTIPSKRVITSLLESIMTVDYVSPTQTSVVILSTLYRCTQCPEFSHSYRRSIQQAFDDLGGFQKIFLRAMIGDSKFTNMLLMTITDCLPHQNNHEQAHSWMMFFLDSVLIYFGENVRLSDKLMVTFFCRFVSLISTPRGLRRRASWSAVDEWFDIPKYLAQLDDATVMTDFERWFQNEHVSKTPLAAQISSRIKSILKLALRLSSNVEVKNSKTVRLCLKIAMYDPDPNEWDKFIHL